MEKGNNFWEENYIIAIWPNGKMESVPQICGEIDHFQPFYRLNEKLNRIMGKMDENYTSFQIPNLLGKLGFIIIYPLTMDAEISSSRVVVFPFNSKREQLLELKKLYDNLSTVQIYYFEKPNTESKLDFGKIIPDLESLKKFVEGKLEELHKLEQSHKNPGR